MKNRLLITAAFILSLGVGVVVAQPFSAQIQQALQVLGLWPYGIYADTEVPTWSAAQQRFLPGSGGGGGGAPTDATYLTQTANGSLSQEQAIGGLASGIMRVANTTGVVTSLTTSLGIKDNISDETGSGALTFATLPTFTTGVILTGAANTSLISGTGFSNTGSDTTSAINYTGTWNTSGAPTFFKVNVTQTAVGNPSYLFDLQVGGASQFSVQNNGVITAANSVNSGNLFTYTGSGPALVPLDNNTDPAALLIRNAGNTTALGIKVAYTTESVSTTKGPTSLESNEMYYTGDTDGQVFTLLNDPVRTGLMWHFVVTQTQASNSMSIAPSAGETLRDGASTCSTFTSTVIGSTATITVLTAGSGGLFVVTNKLGTWVCTP